MIDSCVLLVLLLTQVRFASIGTYIATGKMIYLKEKNIPTKLICLNHVMVTRSFVLFCFWFLLLCFVLFW